MGVMRTVRVPMVAVLAAELLVLGTVGGSAWAAAATASPRHAASPARKPPPASATSTTTPAPTTSTTTTSTATTTTSSGCPNGAVVNASGTWCWADPVGVSQTAYGVGVRVVVHGTVDSVQARVVHVTGGPGCLSGTYCGALVGSMTVTFPDNQPIPGNGDIIDLYGITQTSTLAPSQFVVLGFCDPQFGC